MASVQVLDLPGGLALSVKMALLVTHQNADWGTVSQVHHHPCGEYDHQPALGHGGQRKAHQMEAWCSASSRPSRTGCLSPQGSCASCESHRLQPYQVRAATGFL